MMKTYSICGIEYIFVINIVNLRYSIHNLFSILIPGGFRRSTQNRSNEWRSRIYDVSIFTRVIVFTPTEKKRSLSIYEIGAVFTLPVVNFHSKKSW